MLPVMPVLALCLTCYPVTARIRPSSRTDTGPMSFSRDVVIVGGCGRAGLPLGLAFADRGLSVALLDIDEQAVRRVAAGEMPFDEPGGADVLQRVIGRNLEATTSPTVLSTAESVIVVIGTPVDEHLNPDPAAVPRAIERLKDHLQDGQLLVLRSTVYPGVTQLVEHVMERLGKRIDVAFCPERIAEGRAMTELFELPQLVSGRTDDVIARAEKLFRTLTDQTISLQPEEAELAKLFTNTWRYAKFAVANQLYIIANDFGLDFERIRSALAQDYPRAADMPRAGFAAGPCLLKDTMQLAAFNNNNFVLGHASMMVNEGLPLYVVDRIAKQYDLASLAVGILGMAFKGESDDIRSSLSYKLKRILRFRAREVLCSDPFVKIDGELLPLEEVLDRSDLLILGAPHRSYADIVTDKPIVDIWGLRRDGVRV
jgi:UDP-N-acetyl-D-mannosaminuronic acid dehydrogenase